MVLLHPFALLGLVALAGPIVIHLLMRREAVRLPFPTLRFLQASRASAMRRHRLSDWPLLLVRLAILALAVLALADPVWVAMSRRAAFARISRAIVIDGSGSMDRRDASGARTLRDAARAEAARSAAPVLNATIVEAGSLASGVGAACEWLERAPPSRRELVVISDFQRGAFEADLLGCVPADAGIALAPLSAPEQDRFQGPRILRGTSELTIQITAAPSETAALYVPSAAGATVAGLDVLGAEDERRIADAAIAASRSIGVSAGSAAPPLVLVFPLAPDRASLDRRVSSLTGPWMYALVDRLSRDAALAGAASDPGATPRAAALECATDGRCLAVPIAGSGEPLVYAAAAGNRLVLFAVHGAASLITPALVHGALSARAPFPYAEHEPVSWSAPALRQLERPSGDPPATLFRNQRAGTRRFIWVAVLIALAAEMWLRRGRPASLSTREAVRERVA